MRLKFYDNTMRGIRRKLLEWRLFSLKNYARFFIIALLVFGGWLSFGDYSKQVQDYLLNSGKKATISMGLEVRKIKVVGIKNTPTDLLASQISHIEGSSLYFLDIGKLRQQLESFGWLKDASVKRIFPNALEINVTEHIAKGIWQLQKKHYLITDDGDIISDNIPEAFLDLPLVVGEGANLHLSKLQEILQQSDFLRSQFVGAVWVGERRWNIKLQNGTLVKLPQKGAVQEWQNLHRLAKEELLLERVNIEVLDMRIAGRLIISFKDGNTAEFPYRSGDGA